jgi:hypothetical protein
VQVGRATKTALFVGILAGILAYVGIVAAGTPASNLVTRVGSSSRRAAPSSSNRKASASVAKIASGTSPSAVATRSVARVEPAPKDLFVRGASGRPAAQADAKLVVVSANAGSSQTFVYLGASARKSLAGGGTSLSKRVSRLMRARRLSPSGSDQSLPSRVSVLVAPSLPKPVFGTKADADVGMWATAAPLAFSFQWQSCAPAPLVGGCADIPGATSASYTPDPFDVRPGSDLRVVISAWGPSGEKTSYSASRLVGNLAPELNARPVLSRSADGLGRSLVTSAGELTARRLSLGTLPRERCLCRNIADSKRTRRD